MYSYNCVCSARGLCLGHSSSSSVSDKASCLSARCCSAVSCFLVSILCSVDASTRCFWSLSTQFSVWFCPTVSFLCLVSRICAPVVAPGLVIFSKIPRCSNSCTDRWICPSSGSLAMNLWLCILNSLARCFGLLPADSVVLIVFVPLCAGFGIHDRLRFDSCGLGSVFPSSSSSRSICCLIVPWALRIACVGSQTNFGQCGPGTYRGGLA